MIRNATVLKPAPALRESSDDGWDMSLRREGQVMAELARSPEGPAVGARAGGNRSLLSPAEIEALLRPDLSDLPSDPAAPRATAQKQVPEFDGSPPQHTDEEFIRRLTARLAMAMRDATDLALAAAVQRHQRAPFDAGVRQAGEERGQAIARFVRPDGDVGALLILSPALAQLLIERGCGARSIAGAIRPLSAIDVAILERLIGPVAGAVSPELAFSGIETDIGFAASIAPPATAIVATLSMRVQGEMLTAQLVIDAAFAHAPEAAPVTAPPSGSGLTVTLTARIASLAVPLSRLTLLKPGATLLLGVPADQPVELVSGGEGGRIAAEAEIGRRGNRIALRITRRAGLA